MYVPKSKFNLPKDAPPYMRDLMTQMRNELTAISRATSGQGGTTVIIAGTGGTTSGSTGGGTTGTANVKSGTQVVTAGVSAWVPFPTTFAVAPTVAFCAVAATDGSFGWINVQSLTITTTGFSINGTDILQNGVVFYIATSN